MASRNQLAYVQLVSLMQDKLDRHCIVIIGVMGTRKLLPVRLLFEKSTTCMPDHAVPNSGGNDPVRLLFDTVHNSRPDSFAQETGRVPENDFATVNIEENLICKGQPSSSCMPTKHESY